MPEPVDESETAAAPARLEITCLGAPTARLGGRAAPGDLLWRKHLALLVYLALSPDRSRSKDHVLGFLWPEKDQAHARHSLNEALRRLRLSLGPGRLQTTGDSLCLDARALDVDALHFLALARTNPSQAIELLRGDFLEGFAVDDAPAFEEWAAGQRAQFRAAAVKALVTHGEKLLATGLSAEASEVARRALELEPYAEPACRLGMCAAALAGDPAKALSECHAFIEQLRQIGEEPSRELAALAARIRSGQWRQDQGTASIDEPPLVGRATALGEIAQAVSQVLAKRSQTLLFTGAFGVGKTRLLRRCLEGLALEGGVVAIVRPLESDHDMSWSSLRNLVRAGLLGASGLPATDPHGLRILAALVPELAGRVEPCQPRDHTEVAAAVASLLRAVAEEAPVGLGIDEAQLCDGATLGALGAAMEQVQGASVMLVLASAPNDPDVPHELLQIQSDIGRALPGGEIRLGPLESEHLGQLVAALARWCPAGADRDRLTRRVAFETEGNPFFAVTLLRALEDARLLRKDALEWPPPGATLDSPLPMSAPGLVRRAMVARLVRLDSAAKAVLSAASIGAVGLDLDLTSRLSGIDGPALDEQLAVLERQQFLTFHAGRYRFAAPLVQQVARSEGLTAGQAQQLRLRAITILADRQDLESRVLRAELLARAKPGPEAFSEAVAAARAALAADSLRTARRAIAAAERASTAEPAVDSQELDGLRAMCRR